MQLNRGSLMKTMIFTCLMLISTISFAEVTRTSSENVNPNFGFTDAEIRLMGESMRGVAREEMGELYKYSCLMSDNVEMKCTFKFDLPEDYCWYGAFEANAEYTLEAQGARLTTSDVEWTAEY
jgi:hypothetical protein